MAFRMHYNESSAPQYTQNPVSSISLYANSGQTSKKHSTSLSTCLQWTKKSQKDAYQSMNNQMNESSISRPQQPQSLSKGLPKGKENRLLAKQNKIKQLRKEINRDESSPLGAHRVSRASTVKGTALLDRTYTQQSFVELTQEQTMFSPKILNRSKSMNRKVDVSTLLFQDARRRHEKEQFTIESDRKQKQILMSPKINSNTNALVLRKIEAEYRQLVTEEEINPLIALSVLEELFNVTLNPHPNSGNYESVQKLIGIINEGQSEVKSNRLWQLIALIVTGSLRNSVFTREEENEIIDLYQYFYQRRVTKERKDISPERPTFRPKTLESSSRLAGSFRQKTCEELDNFVENQKITVNVKDGNYTIEDLFILNHHKKIEENQKKKIAKDNKELQLCTFKPDLSPSSSSLNIIKKKPKIPLRVTKAEKLRTQYTSSSQLLMDDSTVTTKINLQKSKQNRQTNNRKARQGRSSTLKEQVKDVDKAILRMEVGRKQNQFSSIVRERGYRKDVNWAQMERDMHRSIVESVQKLKGFKSK